ncbi:hypothetical protein J6590_044958 [Homalodisca vitripennis]|nr:hypothetical protein J6590_044958 [Homalodisca vitripennis]
MDSGPVSVMQNSGYDAGWAEPNLILKMLQAEEQRRMKAEEFQRRPVYQDTWSPWEPICSGATTADSAPTPTPSSLWGSDVWAPPPPDTWAPPGLTPRPPPRLDDPSNAELDIGLDYDPFRSLSNIWAPQTPNFWKPPTTSNN